MSTINAFSFINEINTGKKDIVRNSDNPSLMIKIYNPYITNKAMSQFPDTILIANEMNMKHSLDKLLQFDYYLNMVRKRKRYGKWAKSNKTDDLELLMSYYKIKLDRAREVLSILTAEQFNEIKEAFNKGIKN